MSLYSLRGGLNARVDAEIEVKRSRFLCRLVRVESEPAARTVIAQTRSELWSARHHCSAFVVGTDAVTQVRRSSDDGEPSGTAGMPMLDVLTGSGMVDVVAVVSRYFGGVLLGAGGLVRAYSSAVTAALDVAKDGGMLVERVIQHVFLLEVDHTTAGRVEAELRGRGFTVVETTYRSDVVQLRIAGNEPELRAAVAHLLSGGGHLVPDSSTWIDAL